MVWPLLEGGVGNISSRVTKRNPFAFKVLMIPGSASMVASTPSWTRIIPPGWVLASTFFSIALALMPVQSPALAVQRTMWSPSFSAAAITCLL